MMLVCSPTACWWWLVAAVPLDLSAVLDMQAWHAEELQGVQQDASTTTSFQQAAAGDSALLGWVYLSAGCTLLIEADVVKLVCSHLLASG